MEAIPMSDTTRRLRQVVEEATPGPWEVYDPNEGSGHGPLWSVANDAFHNPPADEDEPWVAVDVHVGGREDAEFIAFARNLFPAMLDVIDAADQAAEAMDDVFSEIGGRAASHHWRKAYALEDALARFREVAGE